jgi:acetyl-CoA decarbonylase/synthase complex subunit alpha
VVVLLEKGPVRFSLKSLESAGFTARDLEVIIGGIEVPEVWEPLGPTPMPKISTLRSWDFKLLDRYKPFYMPFCDQCCLCTYGKCDLTRGKRGSCGIDMSTQQGRIVTLACAIGASTHTSHARHMLERLIEKFGADTPINLGSGVNVEMPNTRLVVGIKPKTLGDLSRVLSYVEEQIVQTLSTTHTGQEASYLDYESKALHLGMLDHVAMEVADVAQIVAFNFPKGDPNAPLSEIGMGLVDVVKPMILLIGHNVSEGVEVINYMSRNNLGKPGEVLEVAGLCCTAHDITRYESSAKIIGPISHQIRFIRSGAADTLIIDEQCITNLSFIEAQKVRTPFIAVSDKAAYGLPDVSEWPVEKIVASLTTGSLKGVFLPDLDKAAAVSVLTALQVAPLRQKFKVIPDVKELSSIASKCTHCGRCRRNCPIDLPVDDAIYSLKLGDSSKLATLYDLCLGCGRCEWECPNHTPVLSLMMKAAEAKVKTEKYRIRVGRGPILDTEIREVGSPIVLGEIPGVVAFVGCANYPEGGLDVALMAREFARRRYIVTTSGCSAMSIAMYRNEEGLTPYEEFSGAFEAGGLVNVGSCVANAHISGAAIKIANIFARRPLRANYEEIADYILNRVGAVGVAWGAYSQKAAAIATGFNRLGVPVILGPQGLKYRRMYLGRREDREAFTVYDARTGRRVWIGPAPEHLIISVENRKEAMVMIAKLCLRPNDTTRGRMIKLTHYIDLYKKIYGKLPEDLHLFIRSEADIPVTFKDEVLSYLGKVGWSPWELPSIDPYYSENVFRKYYRGG